MNKRAFVLPTVLVTGIILLIVLSFTLQTMTTNRRILLDQRLQALAKQAAESGQAKAKACVDTNNKRMTWTDTKPLKPNTDCFGNEISGKSKYVLETNNIRTSYEIYPVDDQDTFKEASGIGKVEFLKKDPNNPTSNVVAKTYETSLSSHIHTGLTFDDVVFGSLFIGNGYNDLYSRTGQTAGFSKAVYFFTRTENGQIATVGYNMDGVLTGYPNHNVIPWADRYTSDPKIDYKTPYHLVSPGGEPIKRMVTDFQGNGWMAFLVADDDRTVYCTGSNINNDFGLGTTGLPRPTWLDGESKINMSNIPANEKIKDLKNVLSTYILTDAGNMYIAGSSGLTPGFGCQDPGCWSQHTGTQPIPVKMYGYHGFGQSNHKIEYFYADSYYNHLNGSIVIAIDEHGNLYGWGRGSTVNHSRIPRMILSSYGIGGERIVNAVTDGGTIWALDSAGRVWSKGKNNFGQLARVPNYWTGHGENTFSLVDTSNFQSGEKVIKIAADGFSVLFLTDKGNVYGAGLNNVNQLGFANNGSDYIQIPKRYDLGTKKAKDIFITSPGIKSNNSVGQEADLVRNSFVITTDGEVYGAGSNHHGQLGVGAPGDNLSFYGGTPQEFSTPQKMILNNNNTDPSVTGEEAKPVVVKQIRSGLGTTIVITEGNFVFTVGNNDGGQLGSGNTIEYHTPMRHKYTNTNTAWYY